MCLGRNYNNLEVKKNNFSPFSEKYLGNRYFVKKKTTSKKKSFINMPSCINYIIGNWCKQRVNLCQIQFCPVHTWISVKFSFKKKLYHSTITASLLCLIVIRALSCAFFSTKLCLSCVKLCAIFVEIEVVFLPTNTTS